MVFGTKRYNRTEQSREANSYTRGQDMVMIKVTDGNTEKKDLSINSARSIGCPHKKKKES